MGRFHIAFNFLAIIGKKFLNSGLEDLLIESGVYAAGTTSALMKGKSYNRGVRAHHKLWWYDTLTRRNCEQESLAELLLL